jgi:hypothetical protein
VAWLDGVTLAQSVYTCLYVHEFSPGRMWDGNRLEYMRFPKDPSRPVQLLTMVLRAAVYGLLKSCDLAWRELTKGHVYEVWTPPIFIAGALD